MILFLAALCGSLASSSGSSQKHFGSFVPAPLSVVVGWNCAMSCGFAAFQFAGGKHGVRWFGVRWFDQKREAWTYLCVLLWSGVKRVNVTCYCWKQKGNNCRVEIKGRSETELCICVVSLAAFSAVLSCGYETVPCISSCHIWFANLCARVAGQCLLLWLGTPSLPLLCSCWESFQGMPLSEKGCRHWSDDMWSKSTNGDDLMQRAGKLCHSALWSGTLHFPFFKKFRLVEVSVHDTSERAGPVLFVCVSQLA